MFHLLPRPRGQGVNTRWLEQPYPEDPSRVNLTLPLTPETEIGIPPEPIFARKLCLLCFPIIVT